MRIVQNRAVKEGAQSASAAADKAGNRLCRQRRFYQKAAGEGQAKRRSVPPAQPPTGGLAWLGLLPLTVPNHDVTLLLGLPQNGLVIHTCSQHGRQGQTGTQCWQFLCHESTRPPDRVPVACQHICCCCCCAPANTTVPILMCCSYSSLSSIVTCRESARQPGKQECGRPAGWQARAPAGDCIYPCCHPIRSCPAALPHWQALCPAMLVAPCLGPPWAPPCVWRGRRSFQTAALPAPPGCHKAAGRGGGGGGSA